MHYGYFDSEQREYMIERLEPSSTGSTTSAVKYAEGQWWMEDMPRTLRLSAHHQIDSNRIDTYVIRDHDDRGTNT